MSAKVKYPEGTRTFLTMRCDEWITFSWDRVKKVDGDAFYICTGLRPIEQAKEAAEQFDIMFESSRGFIEFESE